MKNFESVEGMLTAAEGAFLMETARAQAADAVWVELGSHLGKSTVATLAGLPTTARMVCVDLWDDPAAGYGKGRFPTFQANIAGHLQQIDIIAGRTTAAAARFSDGTVDVVFIDADHTYAAVKQDIRTWWPKVKSGGLLMGHDYAAPPVPRRRGVIPAVDEFVRETGLLMTVGADSIWVIRKP